ncbi:MAG: hypothetical protein WC762_03040 [Methylobacter sp.]
MIIGIAGSKYSGKSTAAEHLFMQGFERLSFATPLKQMALVLLANVGMDPDEIREAEQDKEAIIPKIGVSYRTLLQTLGTDWGRNTISSELWLLCAKQRVMALAGKAIVFDDVRFDGEAAFIREQGGLIIHLIRDTGFVDVHASEKGVTRYPCDAVIGNNGTLDGLRSRVSEAINSRLVING